MKIEENISETNELENMMKKIIALTALALTTTAFGNTTGTLLLKGTVAEEVALAVTAETAASTLDLSASPTNLKVASVNEKSNSNTGYKIDLRSANGGLLKNGALDSLGYEISYGGGSFVAPTTVDQTVKTQNTADVYDVDSDVNIRYTGKPAVEMVEGDYTDTLTFTISAN